MPTIRFPSPPKKFCVECGKPLQEGDRIKNPHNTRDEFCSQKCAAEDRKRYQETGPKIYILHSEGGEGILGVYNSPEALVRGADYWKSRYRKANKVLGRLFYELWATNYPHSAKEWAYVSSIVRKK